MHLNNPQNNIKYKRLTFSIVANGKMEIANILKMASRRAKRGEIWDPGVLLKHIWGTFDVLAFKVIWGHSVHLSQNTQ